MITIDSRRCGAGKTHGFNGTLDKIRENISNNQNTLIALPSIHLVDDYSTHFTNCVKITSIETSNVQSELQNAINEMCEVVIITHAAFLESEIPQSLRKQYTLIIDEAIDPWRFHTYEQTKYEKVFDWNKLIYSHTDYNEPEYSVVKFDDILTNTITMFSSLARDISSPNWINYVRNEGVENLLSGSAVKINIIQELDPLLLYSWDSIHIAAASFDKTFMHMWFKKHKIKFKIVEEFKKHAETLNVYYPDDGDGGWAWSRNKKTTMEWLQNEFHNEIVKSVGPVNYLRLKNNNQSRLTTNEVKVPHNAAGLNNYSHIENVVLESSLNPAPEFSAWLNEIADVYLNNDDAVFSARTGYIYYQVLMRSCLRVGKTANVFVLDKRAVIDLADYFSSINLCDWEPTKPKTYVKKKSPLTNAERAKAHKLKKKYPEKYADMSAREILNSL